MYSCGHNFQGQSVPEYWELHPSRRMPLTSGVCPKCKQREGMLKGAVR